MRFVKSLLSDRPEMLVIGTHWWTEHDWTFCGPVNKLARAVTEGQEHVTNVWPVFRTFMTRVITDNFAMCEIQRSIADWDCSKTLTLLETLKTQKSTSGRILCIFGILTFLTISWMCKEQPSVSHSCTESDGKPALDLWDLVLVRAQGNLFAIHDLKNVPKQERRNTSTRWKI